MKRYEKYIHHKIEWIGTIPAHWKIVRIKNVFRYFGSGTTPKSGNDDFYDDGSINWLNTTDLNNGYVLKTKNKISDLALKELRLKIYPINTLAIAMYGQGKTRGTVGLLRVPSATNQASCMMYKSFVADEKYILWWFINKYEAVRAINVGATQPNMNQDFVKFLLLHLPPKAEQTQIANYLDEKVSSIDKKICLLESKIKYYKELSKSLITNAVFKGLARDIPFKNSGIEWIGMIPKHWEIKRVQELFQERSEKVSDSVFTPLSVSMNGIVPQMDGTAKTKNNDDRKKVLIGDFVINSRSDRRGASGLSIYNGSVSVINIVLKIGRRACGEYYHHFFRSHLFTEEFYKNGKGIVDDLWATKYSVLKAFQVCIPPKKEQKEIATFLDKKTKTIDSIIANITEQTAGLKELRKTLINDVVTGKLKVTE